jgi:patched domain-containing protein
VMDNLLDLQKEWDGDGSIYRLEILDGGAYEAELMRGILTDLPLVPLMGFLMIGFTSLVFTKRDWVNSQCLLGLGAVACVVMGVLSGFGIMFIIGYPFTTLSTALVFVIFGIALDDSFILHAAYLRTDPRKSTIDRVRDFMDEVAVSIFMTTATTEFAFALGSMSTIPAIRWLCVSSF